MARAPKSGFEAPRGRRTSVLGRSTGRAPQPSRDRFGRFTEWIARAMGTPAFLLILTLFCVAWIVWNTAAPIGLRFDDAALGFTALTLMLSLQASYAAPLILLAQNRQDDRDRVQIEQDRQRAERTLADTEYLAREVVALRMALTDMQHEVLTRDVLRQELRALLKELDERDTPAEDERP
ncbi:DUF1003 domain-containing protein [Microbacterium dauci]|uniref:DUF1003 domain-containing protein n=1 Tax=Microbacterium dauci TaxID=3048008 RepID=A0ABT6ZCN0_9MICO|nr:DUF1003 domain-containing protein [Microbacterium sp. LX3-4]MDJ1113490.1 DUF1003 domain-containing protein [Microbacterium sp. LX3-4]